MLKPPLDGASVVDAGGIEFGLSPPTLLVLSISAGAEKVVVVGILFIFQSHLFLNKGQVF